MLQIIGIQLIIQPSYDKLAIYNTIQTETTKKLGSGMLLSKFVNEKAQCCEILGVPFLLIMCVIGFIPQYSYTHFYLGPNQ